MSYSTSNPPALVAQRVGDAAGAIWMLSTTDTLLLIGVADYISDGDALGMKVGDTVIIMNTTSGKTKIATVTAVTAGGAASISVSNLQELTASGAVTPGVSIVELNHATVVVAATIADFSEHAGIFTVKDTSASGTAAHTLTLTAGTFDGTNNVATLNAPGEQLTVFVDDLGNGVILQNTGAVALS
jgi:hypothetical protein